MKGFLFRSELKYLISQRDYEILSQRLTAAMHYDPHTDENGCYRITSLYFDDIYKRAYCHKLAGAQNREKFRIRVYNTDPSYIMLECKMKRDAYIHKPMMRLSRAEYDSLLAGDDTFLLNKSEPVAKTLYLEKRTHLLQPVLLTDYIRKIFVYDGGIRISFDSGIRVAPCGDFFDPNITYYSVSELLPKQNREGFGQNGIVMEIKHNGAVPTVINSLLSGVNPLVSPVSKYVLCMEKLMEVQQHA